MSCDERLQGILSWSLALCVSEHVWELLYIVINIAYLQVVILIFCFGLHEQSTHPYQTLPSIQVADVRCGKSVVNTTLTVEYTYHRMLKNSVRDFTLHEGVDYSNHARKCVKKWQRVQHQPISISDKVVT